MAIKRTSSRGCSSSSTTCSQVDQGSDDEMHSASRFGSPMSTASSRTSSPNPGASVSPKAFAKVRFGQTDQRCFKVSADEYAAHPAVLAASCKEQASQAIVVEELLAPHSIGSWNLHQKHLKMVRPVNKAVRNKGIVELMTNLEDGEFVAVKRIPRTQLLSGPQEFARDHPDAKERPWVDLGILRMLNQQAFEYSVQLQGIYTDSFHYYVTMSFADQGDLFEWSADHSSLVGPQREVEMRPIVRQIWEAVLWLHNHGIAHNDLCLENFLLVSTQGEPKVKVIDFGMAHIGRWNYGTYGAKGYQAPEMHVDAEYDAFLSDGFSIGVVLFGMATSDYPWRSTRPNDCKHFSFVTAHGMHSFYSRRQVGTLGLKVSEVLSAELLNLLDGLLTVDAATRATLGEDCYNGLRNSVWESSWLCGTTHTPLG